MCQYDVLCVKIFQRDQQIKEIAGSNQQVLGDGCNSQITEVMLKELGVFCNQFIHFLNTALMVETLRLWASNYPRVFMFSLSSGDDPHSIHGRLQQHRIRMEC